MGPFPFSIIVLLFLVTVSAQVQPPPPPPSSPSPPQPPSNTNTPRRRGHHRGRHQVNTEKFFGYVRPNDEKWYNNHTLLAEEFLHAHNWVRNQYNLPTFTWDEKLASFARQYLMERYEDCKEIHSDADYGENLFWGKNLHWTPSDAVYHWYAEKNYYDFKTLNCLPSKDCGHFTQLVWRDSTRLGCALQHCSNAGAGMLIGCEYDPPGNYANENPLEAHI